MRTGQLSTFPDGVAYPMSNQDVVDLIQYAHRSGIHLIPYGGGTSVVGHIDPIISTAPILTIDMSRMNRLIDLDAQSLLATFNAGALSPIFRVFYFGRLGSHPFKWSAVLAVWSD
jgi:alkyldihydroxyacetonephosphate synthase